MIALVNIYKYIEDSVAYKCFIGTSYYDSDSDLDPFSGSITLFILELARTSW